MSSGSYSSNNPDNNEYGQGGYNRQFSTPYNDSQAPQVDGMTTQPSVGRFTEQDKANSMFSRKPTTHKNYDGTPALAGQSNHGVHHSQDSSSSQSNAGGIVNLRPAPRGEVKMNKSTSKGKK